MTNKGGSVPHETDTAVTGRRAYDDYVKHAMAASETVETFYVHLNAEGKPWMLTMGSKELPTREEMIASWMEDEQLLIVGRHPHQERFSYYPSYEEAEQKVDLVLGVWPLPRILCSASGTAYDRLTAEHTPPLEAAA